MTTFDDRQNAFEAKFAHDGEMRFKAVARRNRLLGLWAAGLLGRSGDEAAAYAAEVVRADFQEAGDEDVVRKLAADLGAKADVATIRQQMQACLLEAQRQLVDEGR
jgi:hypothetical protein